MLASSVQAADDIGDPGRLGDLSIEELMALSVERVYSASKYEQKVTRAPASVTIVTADDIRQQGHRTLADILRSVRGLYVADDRNYSYVGVRGFLRPGDYNSRVLVLMDGHRMNDAVYDSAYVGYDAMVGVDQIERVEFIRGPGSSIYGSNAFFGVINVITRRGRQLEGAAVSAAAGRFDSYQADFSYGKLLGNGLDLAVSGTGYSSAGQPRIYYPEFDQRTSAEPRAANDGVAEHADGEDAYSFHGRASYGDWTVSGFGSTRDKEVPTASFGTVFNDGRQQTRDTRVYLDLAYDHAFNPALQLLSRLSYDRYAYYGDYPYDYAGTGDPADVVINKDEALAQWLGSEVQLTGRLFERHTLLVGAEYRNNFEQEQLNYDEGAADAPYVAERHSSTVLGVYAQGEFALSPAVQFIAGARYDRYFDSFGGSVNPRASLILNPWTETTVKLLYGKAFRAPNAYERFYYQEQKSLPPLEPETIRTYELVLEQYFGPQHRLTLSAYRYTADQLITQASGPGGELFFDNAGRARANGVELEANGKYANGLRIRASHAIQKTKDVQTGQELSSSPRHLAKLNLIAPLAERLSAGLELNYHGSVDTLGGARAPDFLIGNLNLLSERVLPGLDLSAGVYNVFDRNHHYPGAEDHLQDVLGQAGRSFRLKAVYRF